MIRLQEEDFDLSTEMKRLVGGRTDIGAVVSFTGQVRDRAAGEPLKEMRLEHYPAMVRRQLEKIENDARQRWPLEEVLILHRYGVLKPGEQIVLVITASSHRKAAFEAAEFLMDWLKTKAPFWKCEMTDKGAEWVDAKEKDDQATARWSED